MGGVNLSSVKSKLEDVETKLAQMPKGTLTYKRIKGKEQPYIQSTVDGKSVSYYVKMEGRELVIESFKEKEALKAEKKRLTAFYKEIKSIIDKNPYMEAKLGLGYQYFDYLSNGKLLYVDKTGFINEWLKSTERTKSFSVRTARGANRKKRSTA